VTRSIALVAIDPKNSGRIIASHLKVRPCFVAGGVLRNSLSETDEMSRAKRDRTGKKPMKYGYTEVEEAKTAAPSRAASKKNDGASKVKRNPIPQCSPHRNNSNLRLHSRCPWSLFALYAPQPKLATSAKVLHMHELQVTFHLPMAEVTGERGRDPDIINARPMGECIHTHAHISLAAQTLSHTEWLCLAGRGDAWRVLHGAQENLPAQRHFAVAVPADS
jgi:hypothetical protein